MARADKNSKAGAKTRAHILRAALKRFADAGYAATSIQQIVSDARVSKPALYYHFHDKAGLFAALVNEAHEGRFRVVQNAAAKSKDIRGQLREILVALFDYFHQNRDLTRLAFSTAYAAPGEMPPGLCQSHKCKRNLEFIHALIKQAQAAGKLDGRFDSWELAYGFYGQTNFYITAHLLMPSFRANRKAAERIVELFLAGAGAKKKNR